MKFPFIVSFQGLLNGYLSHNPDEAPQLNAYPAVVTGTSHTLVSTLQSWSSADLRLWLYLIWCHYGPWVHITVFQGFFGRKLVHGGRKGAVVCSHRSSHLRGWGPAPWSTPWSPPALKLGFSHGAHTRTCRPHTNSHHLELFISLRSKYVQVCVFGTGCCPPVFPATRVSAGFLQPHHRLAAAQACSSPFPAQVKLKGKNQRIQTQSLLA